jgi:hypothetical protein
VALRTVPVNDGEKHFVPPVRTVDVTRPELGRKAVAVWVEDEQRMIADGLEVAVVGGLLLRPPCTGLSELSISRVTRRFGDRVRRVLDQCCVEANKPLVVALCREGVRLEPVQGGGEGDTRLPRETSTN